MSAAQMHFDEVNAAGGIHGRKIRFVVEDSGYQMPKAMQAYNKLINRDKVFAMLLSLGTPMNIAGMKLMTPKNIPNIVPLSAARQMLEEPIRLRFVGSASYYDQTRLGARYLAEQHGTSKVCTMFIPSDFGKEIEEALRDEADANAALVYTAETTHKPDDGDFVGSLQKLNAEGVRADRRRARHSAGHHRARHREEARARPPQVPRLVGRLPHGAREGAGGRDRRAVRDLRLGGPSPRGRTSRRRPPSSRRT